MDQTQWDLLDDYLCSQLVAPDQALDGALRSSAQAGLRPINVAPNQGKFLQMLARVRGAKRILEIGTLGGYSTIWLARALPSDGTLVTLEFSPEHAAVAKKNIESAGLSEKVSVMVGAAVESLRRLIEERAEPFDFVFIDADKKTYPEYLTLSLELCSAGAIIVGDNIIRRGKMADAASTDPDVIGLRQYFDLLAKNPRLDSTAIQTVGSKGWDGFSITLVS
ncbi:methyltransferase [Burkholderia sp. Leaf177]|uniref:O-methyltransferase n=1 Tax=Burkholderia sp. Leaf177 TaxID=1736287 RepID=UPI0006F64C80|nr:O-methyltransferase [Burkholderia sp. Leaf177]KQR81646.1 methyltransferase [Burkholderia sp. Leaf177]